MNAMRLLLPVAAAAAVVLPACDDSDTTSTIGSSLVTDQVEIIEDSSFTVTGRTVANPEIMARTLTQLLGRLDATEYGSISSDIVTQFMPAARLDTTGMTPESIDSVKLLLFINTGDFTGDSIVPMGVNAYRLTRELPSPIYSDFNPEGYYDKSSLMGSTVYTANAMHNDSLNGLGYRTIYITLPRQFGVDFYREFLESPSTFQTPEAFAKWFPGLYITTSFGNGRVVNITSTRINFYYHMRKTETVNDTTVRDTVLNAALPGLAVTPEIITNNNLKYVASEQLRKRIADGEIILSAPAGTDVEIQLPIRDIISRFRAAGDMAVFNTLRLRLPVEEIENTYGIEPPQNLLLILSKDRSEFFANNKLVDDKTSFYATYDATTHSYYFSSMRDYVMEMLQKDEITPEDYTFTLTPIGISRQTIQNNSSYYYYPTTSTIITAMAPFIEAPAMARLLLDSATVDVTYTRQLAR